MLGLEIYKYFSLLRLGTLLLTFLASTNNSFAAIETVKPADTSAETLQISAKNIIWEELGNYEGISVFRREIDGSDTFAFKGTGVLQASLPKVVSVIRDIKRKPEWVDRFKFGEIVREISPHERIEYLQGAAPWPVKDRDSIYVTRFELHPETRSVTFDFKSCDCPEREENSDFVRAKVHYGKFILTSIPDESGKIMDSRTRIEAELHADPMGSIPKFIVNMVQKKWPRMTLEGLMRQVQKPDIEDYTEVCDMLKKTEIAAK